MSKITYYITFNLYYLDHRSNDTIKIILKEFGSVRREIFIALTQSGAAKSYLIPVYSYMNYH